MKPLWLLENVDVQTDLRRLIAALKEQNINHIVLGVDKVRRGRFPQIVNEAEGCVISYGSLRYVDAVQRHTNFIPGAWVDFDALRCDKYLTHLSEFSIHKEFIFLPLGVLLSKWSSVFNRFEADSLFIKPNECRKSFGGGIVNRSEELNFYNHNAHVDPESLCLIASVTEGIEKEWRFTATAKGVISGSQYEPKIGPTLDTDAIKLAEKIAEVFFRESRLRIPSEHPVMIDIGKMGDEYRMIELGGFACAGLYDCDYDSLVTKLTECGVKEWESYK